MKEVSLQMPLGGWVLVSGLVAVVLGAVLQVVVPIEPLGGAVYVMAVALVRWAPQVELKVSLQMPLGGWVLVLRLVVVALRAVLRVVLQVSHQTPTAY